MKKQYEIIERFLDYLIDPNACIDTYGRTYIEDLDNIIVENHEFNFKTQKFPDPEAQAWFERILSTYKLANCQEFIAFVKAHVAELDLANVRPRTTFHGETIFESEPTFQNLQNSDSSIEEKNEFQKEWSLRAIKDIPGNDIDANSYEMYLGSDRINPWTYLVRRERARGNISAEDQVICIGNRWLGEIFYFRTSLGLKNTRGVDLVSSNPELVVSADMHHLPFEDNSIKLIFTRGAINKSYDVRLLVKEMLRVLQKDGFLIIETPGPYGYGVTKLGQTDVKSAKNLLRLFKGKTDRIIYSEETKPHRFLFDATNLIRIFIQIDKNRQDQTVKFEQFPHWRFKIYDVFRRYFLRLRHKLKVIGVAPRQPS